MDRFIIKHCFSVLIPLRMRPHDLFRVRDLLRWFNFRVQLGPDLDTDNRSICLRVERKGVHFYTTLI